MSGYRKHAPTPILLRLRLLFPAPHPCAHTHCNTGCTRIGVPALLCTVCFPPHQAKWNTPICLKSASLFPTGIFHSGRFVHIRLGAVRSWYHIPHRDELVTIVIPQMGLSICSYQPLLGRLRKFCSNRATCKPTDFPYTALLAIKHRISYL